MNKEITNAENSENQHINVPVVMYADMPWKRELKTDSTEIEYHVVNDRHSFICEVTRSVYNTPRKFANYATELILVSYSGFLNHIIKTFPQRYAEANGEATDQPYIYYSLSLITPTTKQYLDKHEVKLDKTLIIDESTFINNFMNINKEAIRSALIEYAKAYIFVTRG